MDADHSIRVLRGGPRTDHRACFKLAKHPSLIQPYVSENGVTPLMLFFHLYTSDKCRELIDAYLSTLEDQSVLLQCDRWNRSYLAHLLCGQCQHESDSDPSDVAIDDWSNRCPHASYILSRFAMLHTLGNRCENPIKTIFRSMYCLPLRMLLFNYLRENDPSFQLNVAEFFQYFPLVSLPTYSTYLKRILHEQDLSPALLSVIKLHHVHQESTADGIRFLLRLGARLENTEFISFYVMNLLALQRSTAPFILLDYGFYVGPTHDSWSWRSRTPRVVLYICRLLQCGYPTEFRANFDTYKASMPESTVKLIEEFIDMKVPPRLSRLCLQTLRSSLRDLGDQTLDQLRDRLSAPLHHSIVHLGHDECRKLYHDTMNS